MKNGFRNTFRSLKYPNYRLFITGQSISILGTWMQRTAVSWVVYELTNSTFMLGLTMFASQFPSFIFSLYGGIISDRYDRHKIIIVTQIASMIQALVLATLVYFGWAEVWHIMALSALLGVVNAFDIPARQPLVHQLVSDPADVQNALALNSSVVNIARFVGPALSGFVLAAFGAGICFYFNALSFLAVIISLFMLKLTPQVIRPKTQKAKMELIEGFRYMKNHRVLAPIMLYILFISLFVMPYDTLIPEFAKSIFSGDAKTYGYILSSVGFGALMGTIFLATLKSEDKQGFILLINTLALGVGLICFSLIHFLPATLIFGALAGFGAMTQTTICLTVIQTRTEPEMRGRMISYFAMALFGMLPIGSLIIGAVSHQLGSSVTMLIQGIIALIIAMVFYPVFRKPVK
ncbi:MAG: MFS transporter [Bacteroidetes bacterium]|nr:MFS transporter [Bacteroidota bacterium]